MRVAVVILCGLLALCGGVRSAGAGSETNSGAARADVNSLIRPGDLLQISVTEVQRPETLIDIVKPGGTIELPAVGKVKVAGRSLRSAGKIIERAYVRNGIYERVTVSVATAFSFSSTAAGSPYLFISPALDGDWTGGTRRTWFRLGTNRLGVPLRYTPSDALGDFWMPGEYERLLEQRLGLPRGSVNEHFVPEVFRSEPRWELRGE